MICHIATLCSSLGLLISDRPDPMTNCMLQVMAASGHGLRDRVEIHATRLRTAAPPERAAVPSGA